MVEKKRYRQTVALAAIGGVIVGGVLVAFVTRAIPKMMSQMMARSGKDGCAPSDI